ncbi:hypothetical protein UCDDS831_g09332 [Diplodia seriata]|uniref:Uncharacterized protein n=1 Tax=Diplodia seriata TaxID=420778 RepID=A0A0G2FMA0_9PEZI|nr:hypothetical protein UCDDS831_g09332 [Diplodia seriata]
MAFPCVQVSEEEFREFGRKHFPGAPQPAILPPFVTSSTNAPPQSNTSPSSAVSDIAYNAGFTAGASFGHASGRVSGYTEGYNAALALFGRQTANVTVPAERSRNHVEGEGEDQVYEAHGYEDDTDWGFYSDGAKRTIDDEAVQFYRRSELMQMLKDAKNRVADRKDREREEQFENEDKFEAEVKAQMEVDAQEKIDTHDHGDAECNASEQIELDKAEPQVGYDVEEVTQPIDPLASSTGSPLTNESNSIKPEVVSSFVEEDQADSDANTPSSTSTTLVGSESCKRPIPRNSKKKMTAIPEANRGKKRKRSARNLPVDIEGITYRRIARELDEMPSESVELDY